MNCEKVREVVEGKRDMEKKEEVIFLRHVRVCPKCREEIPFKERERAMRAVLDEIE